jgi:hypothetical protein
MTKDEALTLAAEMERGQFSTTLLPAAAELRRLHEENQKLRAQQVLDRKAENARELGLDYEPEQEPCGGCGGSGWVPRDPDIGTDQECFVCGGSGVIKPEQEPVAIADGTFNHNCPIGTPLYTAPAHQNVNVDDIGVPVGVGGWLTTTSSQPEHEPVAWMHTKIDGVVVPHRPADLNRHPDRWTALYKDPKPCPTCEALARTVMLDQTSHDATPPQRKPLTEQEIGAILEDINAFGTRLYTFARAIEAAHGIKG